MKKLFLFVLFLASYASAQDGDSLSGVWQDVENVGSGYSNIYMFAPGGKYWYFTNSMNCEERLTGFSGSYKIPEDDVISLSISKRYMLVGGYLAPSSGSCASDSMLVDALKRTLVYRKPKVKKYSVSNIHTEGDRRFIFIQGTKFWFVTGEYNNVVKEYIK